MPADRPERRRHLGGESRFRPRFLRSGAPRAPHLGFRTYRGCAHLLAVILVGFDSVCRPGDGRRRRVNLENVRAVISEWEPLTAASNVRFRRRFLRSECPPRPGRSLVYTRLGARSRTSARSIPGTGRLLGPAPCRFVLVSGGKSTNIPHSHRTHTFSHERLRSPCLPPTTPTPTSPVRLRRVCAPCVRNRRSCRAPVAARRAPVRAGALRRRRPRRGATRWTRCVRPPRRRSWSTT